MCMPYSGFNGEGAAAACLAVQGTGCLSRHAQVPLACKVLPLQNGSGPGHGFVWGLLPSEGLSLK